MDIIDEANERSEYFTAKAIERARDGLSARMLREPDPDCEDCGEAIPEKRRMAAPWCTRCVECQRKFEGGRWEG